MSGPLPDAPVRFPVSLQAWQDLTFLHWAYRPGTRFAHGGVPLNLGAYSHA